MVEVNYFQDDDGTEPVREYTDAVEAAGGTSAAAAIFRELQLLEATDPQHLANLGIAELIDRDRRIWELKPGAHRVAYVMRGGVIVVLHAWRKTRPEAQPDGPQDRPAPRGRLARIALYSESVEYHMTSISHVCDTV